MCKPKRQPDRNTHKHGPTDIRHGRQTEVQPHHVNRPRPLHHEICSKKAKIQKNGGVEKRTNTSPKKNRSTSHTLEAAGGSGALATSSCGSKLLSSMRYRSRTCEDS